MYIAMNIRSTDNIFISLVYINLFTKQSDMNLAGLSRLLRCFILCYGPCGAWMCLGLDGVFNRVLRNAFFQLSEWCRLHVY